MLQNQNYVTVTELMERWRCSRPTALRYLQRYNAKIIRLGKKPLIPEEEVARIEGLQTRDGH